MPKNDHGIAFQSFFKRHGYATTLVNEQITIEMKQSFSQWFHNQFRQDVYAIIEQRQELYNALFYFYAYMARTQENALPAFRSITLYHPEDFLVLDGATQRN